MTEQQRNRAYAAVAIRADGRRVRFAVREENVAVSFLGVVEAIGLAILALITGSRRESGGRR